MRLLQGDNLPLLKLIEDNSVDAVVTDPPYGLSFMGKKWDYDVPSKELWEEVLRVLKPGGHLLSFSGTRTYHRMAVNIEDAGFEIRDMIEWVYSTGFPKSLNLNKALQKKCSCGNMVEYDNKRTKQNTKHNLRLVSESDLSQEINPTEEQGEVLQSELSEQSLSLQQSESTENVRREESLLEGGNNIEKTERELQRSDISEMSKGISSDGEEGRIYNATQTGDGTTSEQIIDENGSSASHRPQSEQQQDRKPCAFCKQLGTQETRRLYEATYGVGSALKPAHEPICLARKPLSEKTLVDNFIKYGTGGINIEQSRVLTPDDEARKQRILAGEVVCNAFCDKHELYPSSLDDMLSFSQQQLLDFYQHIFSELGSYSISYTNLLHNLNGLDYKSCKQLLGVPYDCGRLSERVDEYVRGRQQAGGSQSDYPTLSRLYGECVRWNLDVAPDVFPLNNDVQSDILHYLSSKENNLLDNNPHLVFVLVFLAYNLLVNNNLHNHYTTCKNKIQAGRFPSNLLHDNSEEVRECFPETNASKKRLLKDNESDSNGTVFSKSGYLRAEGGVDDSGGNASRFFKSIKQDLHCSLCYDTIDTYQLTKNICNNTNVNNVEKSSETTQAITESTALKNATGKVNENLVQNVKSAGNLCDLCGTSIAQRLVAIMQDQSQESTLGELSMPEHKKQILEKCLVSFVELRGNTDTIPTMENLNLLFGYVLNATEEYTQKCEDTKSEDKNQWKSLIYKSKASKSERNRGCEELEEKVKVFNGQSDKPSTEMKDVEKRFTTLPKANNHPTVKPVALMEYLIEMVTPKGGTVLDPYMGSGTTGIACKQKGFDFIGIEMDAEYCKIAEARIHNTPAQQTLI